MVSDADSSAHALLKQMAAAIVAEGPADWRRAVLTAGSFQYGSSLQMSYETDTGTATGIGPGTGHGRTMSVHDQLRALLQALGDPRGWRDAADGTPDDHPDCPDDPADRPNGPDNPANGAESAGSAETVEPFDGVDVELVVEPSGRYEATVSGRAARRGLRGEHDGHLFVLDPDHRPLEPGAEAPGPAHATPAGDPAEAVALMRECVHRRAAIIGAPEQLPSPAAPSLVAAAEQRFGTALPDDLKALYSQVADGDAEAGIFANHEWLSLATLLSLHDPGHAPRMHPWTGWPLGWNAVVLDAEPAETVRRVSAHDGWLPFATDNGGNYLAVDSVPAANGRPGQVIRIGRDCHDGPEYVADSVTALLRRQLAVLDNGDYDIEEDFLELGRGSMPERENRHRLIVDTRKTPLRAVSPHVQCLIVWDAESVDLTLLQAARNLRELWLVRCGTADLTPLRDLPVETLRLELRDADLSPLAGHPTLRTVRLAAHRPDETDETNDHGAADAAHAVTETTGAGAPGDRSGPADHKDSVHGNPGTADAERPFDVALLAQLPQLYGLDLSGAEVSGLESVATVPGLRLLSLNRSQWDGLRETSGIPISLAAAMLCGGASHSAAIAWSRGFGHGDAAVPVLRFSGQTEG